MRRKNDRKAHRLYNYYLKNVVFPMIGDKTTYLDQLYRAGKRLFGIKFKGVFPSDRVPKLNDLAPYCILNLDKSGEPGSHWIALAKIKNKDSCIVYDSFGRDHKLIIPSLNSSGNGKIKNADRDAEQNVLSTNCGARCLSFLIVLDKHGEGMAKLI